MTAEDDKRQAAEVARETLCRRQRDERASEDARRAAEQQRTARENAARYRRDQQKKGK